MSKVKTITLSQSELATLVEEAVSKGVQRHMEAEEKREQKRQSRLLYNTKVLLENYRKLKTYLEKATSSLEDVARDRFPEYSVELLEVFGLRVEDKKSYSIARGVANVTILVNHLEKMLEVYKQDCLSSDKETDHRKWRVLNYLYIGGERRMSIGDIAEIENVDPRVIQKDAKAAREDMKVLLFGIEALYSDIVK